MRPRAALIILIAAVALFGAAAAVSAGEQGEPGSCDGGTYQMVDCLNAQRAHWDKELTIAYQGLMKSLASSRQKMLRDAERAWIKFRDANCAFVGSDEGSIALVEAAECLRSMTEKRARELSAGNSPGSDKPGNEDRD
jgi:uncharacterized protein YecT (DUF1311 family)